MDFEFDFDPALRPGMGGAQNQRFCMDFLGFSILILTPRCARGRRQRKIIDSVRLFDFVFDSALRPGGDTAQDHNHKLCDPALRWALGPGPEPRSWARARGPGT